MNYEDTNSRTHTKPSRFMLCPVYKGWNWGLLELSNLPPNHIGCKWQSRDSNPSLTPTKVISFLLSKGTSCFSQFFSAIINKQAKKHKASVSGTKNMPLLAPFPPLPTHEEEIKTGSCEISTVSLGTAATMLGLLRISPSTLPQPQKPFIAATTPA